MHFVQHPFFERDLIGIVDHIVDVTQGDVNAALRRLDEIDAILEAIKDNPASGVRLGGALDGWLVRHGGAGHLLTIVFRPDLAAGRIYLALAAFGGRDRMTLAPPRNTFSE